MASDLLGEIVVIKKNGGDGARFPLKAKQCTFGRDPECDIRIQIPQVEDEHAKIYFENGKMWLQNLSSKLPTLLNSKAINLQEVSHNDVFTITQRSFRFEFPERRKSSTPKRRSSTKKTPLRAVQGSPRTPVTGDSLRTSISKLRRISAAVLEENESLISPVPLQEKLSKSTPVKQKENTPENDLLANTPSILKKKGSAKRSDKKRISFGPTLSPELFDKTLPPSTPLRKGRSPGRRLSEPLQLAASGSKSKKRCSLGTALGRMPIMEEEEETKIEEKAVDLCDTPPQNLPSPLLPAATVNETEEDASEEHGKDAIHEETTPKKTKKQGLLIKERRLATPIRRQIHAGIAFKATKRKMHTPLRKDIQSKPKLKRTLKKIATPLKKEIENGPSLKKAKQKMATPLRESIQKGVSLRVTKKKLQTPLRNDIKKGTKLRPTKPKLPTPVRDEIKSKPKLKETKRKMRKSLQEEIIKGTELRSKFAGVKQMPAELKEEISKGRELKKVMKCAPTPLRKKIEEGVKLKETKKKLRKSLQTDIVKGKCLRKTKMSAPTPLRKAIKEGKQLRKTKQTAPTPLRDAIKRGVTLRTTKKQLDEDLQAEIKQGKELSNTKLSAPTPFKNEIKKGVKLRQTKKKLGADLQKEIQKGKELRKTKRTAPTPFRNEVKRGVKLRQTKKRLSQRLQNEIKAGTTLAPLMKKALKTPLRAQIRAGVKLRETNTEADEVCQVDLLNRADDEYVTSPTFENMNAEDNTVSNQGENRRPVLRAKRRMTARNEPMPIIAHEIPRRLSGKVPKPAKKRICRRSTPKKMAELREKLQTAEENEEDIAGIDDPEILSPVIAFPSPDAKPAPWRTSAPQFSDMYLSETSCEDISVLNEIPGLIERLNSASDAENSDVNEFQGINETMKTPKANDDTVEHDLGLKRLMKTPRTKDTEKHEVEGDLGLKRLMKTPKADKHEAVEENLGLKRVLKTPEVNGSVDPVEEKLGLKRLLKTPKEKKAEESTELNCNVALTRLLKTPKVGTHESSVEQNFGLKRLMKTPKAKDAKMAQVESNMGLRRLMQTPREKTGETKDVDGEIGLRRMMQTPKTKGSSVNSPHLDGLFYEMTEKKVKQQEVTEKLGLKRLMQTPKDGSKRAGPKYSLDAGSLPALFATQKQMEEPVEDMQLQELFVEVDPHNADAVMAETGQSEHDTEVEDSTADEQQVPVRTTRRGRKNVAKATSKVRSTRATRGSKQPVVEESVAEESLPVHVENSSDVSKSADSTCNEEVSVEPATKRQTRRGNMTRIARSAEMEVEDNEKAKDAEKAKETRESVMPIKRGRRTRNAVAAQEDLVEPNAIVEEMAPIKDVQVSVVEVSDEVTEAVMEDSDAVTEVVVAKRSSRKGRGGAVKSAPSAKKRATRSTEVENESHAVSVEGEDISTNASLSDHEEVIIVAESTRSTRTRSKRKSIEEVVQTIAEKKNISVDGAKATMRGSEKKKEVEAKKEAVRPGRKTRRKAVAKKVCDDDDNAGVTNGVVKTPAKVKFNKTDLHPIPEETASEIGTPWSTTKEIVDERVPPITTRSTRGRGKRVSKQHEDETAPKRKASKNEEDDEVQDGIVQVSAEPVTRASARQTRSKQVSQDTEVFAKPRSIKRKKPTRSSANKDESTDTEISTEEIVSKPKRAKRATLTSKPAEGRTRRSSRLRDC